MASESKNDEAAIRERTNLISIPVKLPDSLRDQLKIPLGLLLARLSQDNKENIQKHLSENSYIITVGDRTTEKMIDFGLIPSLQIIDGQEKRQKENIPKSFEMFQLNYYVIILQLK